MSDMSVEPQELNELLSNIDAVLANSNKIIAQAAKESSKTKSNETDRLDQLEKEARAVIKKSQGQGPATANLVTVPKFSLENFKPDLKSPEFWGKTVIGLGVGYALFEVIRSK